LLFLSVDLSVALFFHLPANSPPQKNKQKKTTKNNNNNNKQMSEKWIGVKPSKTHIFVVRHTYCLFCFALLCLFLYME